MHAAWSGAQAPAAVPPVLKLLYAPAAAVPEEPPDLSAWRRGRTRRKNRNDTGSGALKRIRREISDDGSEVLLRLEK